MFDKTELTEFKIKEMEAQVKEMKKKLKEMNKPKTVTISGKDHSEIKYYCQKKNLNIGEWVSTTLLKEINSDPDIAFLKSFSERYKKDYKVFFKDWKNEDCRIYDKRPNEEIWAEEKKELIKKYSTNFNTNLKLIKTDKLIISKYFELVGYSIIDSKNIHKYIGTESNFNNKILEIRKHMDVTFVYSSEVSNTIIPEDSESYIDNSSLI